MPTASLTATPTASHRFPHFPSRMHWSWLLHCIPYLAIWLITAAGVAPVMQRPGCFGGCAFYGALVTYEVVDVAIVVTALFGAAHLAIMLWLGHNRSRDRSTVAS